MQKPSSERGTALVEAAILIPVLVLILYWSSAFTDVLVLKLKASEAARYALFETTVWKSPAQIDKEVQARFADLRSPASISSKTTGLLLYSNASDLTWHASVDTTSPSNEVRLSGDTTTPSVGGNAIARFVGTVSGFLASSLQGVMRFQKFNTFGKAQVYVSLGGKKPSSSTILSGGDLVGARGRNDLGAPSSLLNLAIQAPFASQRPMQIVFDTWKAWPKPAAYTVDGADTNVNADPMQTYPVVERQVEAQVDKIAFFGIRNFSWFRKIDDMSRRILRSGVVETIVGGDLPDVFATGRMDDPRSRGPITILPQGPPDASFVPNTCDRLNGGQGSCAVQRVGDVRSSTDTAKTLDGDDAFTDGEDRTRYTVPYKVNTPYWTQSGGADSGDWGSTAITAMPRAIATQNGYVTAWGCRGHYFAGAQRAEEANVKRRYGTSCP